VADRLEERHFTVYWPSYLAKRSTKIQAKS